MNPNDHKITEVVPQSPDLKVNANVNVKFKFVVLPLVKRL